jgi:hypothetical protein
MTVRQRWLQHPEKLWVRNTFFRIHYWMGMVAALYVLLMSISGSQQDGRVGLAGAPAVLLG